MTIKTVDKHFSKFIRLRDSVRDKETVFGNCCTCGKKIIVWYFKGYNGQAHCGHFMSRRHWSTRWDEKNCALQCAGCNSFNQGKQFEFSIYIDEKHGKGTAEKLLIKSKQYCKKPDRYTLEQYSKEYREKSKELEKKLGIK